MSTARIGISVARRALIALLLLWSPHLAVSLADEGTLPWDGRDWSTLGGAELAVLHHSDDARYAARVLEIYENEAPSIAASMGLSTLSPLRVVIASTDSEFSQLTYHGAPDWGVGCAMMGRGLVVLKSPRIVDYPLQMESVVEHELAHIAAGKVLRGIDVPRWFDEGIAQAVAGEWRMGQASGLAAAAKSGTLPPLSSLDASFPSGREAAAQAYAMSFQAVRFLMNAASVREPGGLVRAVADAGDFDSAVAGLTGMTPADFERSFAEFISRRFTWGTLLNDGRVLFTLAAVFFVVAFGVRLKRSRAKMREWAEQEKRAAADPAAREAREDSRWH